MKILGQRTKGSIWSNCPGQREKSLRPKSHRATWTFVEQRCRHPTWRRWGIISLWKRWTFPSPGNALMPEAEVGILSALRLSALGLANRGCSCHLHLQGLCFLTLSTVFGLFSFFWRLDEREQPLPVPFKSCAVASCTRVPWCGAKIQLALCLVSCVPAVCVCPGEEALILIA